MTPEGFYRVTLEGHPGVGCCRHNASAVRGETYEVWNVLYARPLYGEAPHILTAHLNSTDRHFASLVVGKRVPGLPRRFNKA